MTGQADALPAARRRKRKNIQEVRSRRRRRRVPTAPPREQTQDRASAPAGA